MIAQERLVVLAVVFTMALAVSLTLNPGVLPVYAVALAVLACASVPYLLHTHPAYSFSPLRMIIPAAIALSAPSVAHQLSTSPFQLIGVFGPGALLYGVVQAEYLVIRPSEAVPAQAARLLLTLAVYAVALTFYLLIYQVKERSIISGTLVALVSGLLAMRVLAIDRRLDHRTALYAAVAGLGMAEIIWPLNYWVLGIVAGGFALLLAFYVLVGLMRPLLAGQFSQAALLEYGTVSLAGLAVVFGATKI